LGDLDRALRAGIVRPDGWTLLFEWPYCYTCGEYAPEHKHAGRRTDSGYYKAPNAPADFGLLSHNWPYAALGVPSNAEGPAIRSAYRKRLFETHPDRGGDAEECRKVIAAFDELKARGRVT
jgi:hypothetical protein